MRLSVDISSNRIVSAPGIREAVRQVEFKRGDGQQIEVRFYNGLTRVDLANGATGKFGIKEAGKYDADFIVSDLDWTESTEDIDGTTYKVYTFEPNFNTTELNALLASGDADDSNDEAYLDAMLEIEWDEAGQLSSTQTVTARIHNDVIKGAEGVPTSGTPPYPPSQELADHLWATDNPHNVTPAQIGAATTAELNALQTADAVLAQRQIDWRYASSTDLFANQTGILPAQIGRSIWLNGNTLDLTGMDAVNPEGAVVAARGPGTLQLGGRSEPLVNDAEVVTVALWGGVWYPVGHWLADVARQTIPMTFSAEQVFAAGARRTSADTNDDNELVRYAQLLSQFGLEPVVADLPGWAYSETSGGNNQAVDLSALAGTNSGVIARVKIWGHNNIRLPDRWWYLEHIIHLPNFGFAGGGALTSGAIASLNGPYFSTGGSGVAVAFPNYDSGTKSFEINVWDPQSGGASGGEVSAAKVHLIQLG